MGFAEAAEEGNLCGTLSGATHRPAKWFCVFGYVGRSLPRKNQTVKIKSQGEPVILWFTNPEKISLPFCSSKI